MTAENQISKASTAKSVDYTDHVFIHATLFAIAGIFTVITFAGI